MFAPRSFRKIIDKGSGEELLERKGLVGALNKKKEMPAIRFFCTQLYCNYYK